jgi:thiamine-phosphate pyrophosphorylase
MPFDKNTLLLYAVTDRCWLGSGTLYEQVEECLKGGVTLVQLREKEMDAASFINEALEIKKLCRRYGVPFIVNDSIEVALAADADGVHVGQRDLDAQHARQRIGPGKILGVSVHTAAQALIAQQNGADYLGVGAVFTTATKQDADTVLIETLKAICSTVSIPVVAIGGINRHNITKLKGTGISGAAVVSALFAESDITGAARELLALAKETVL